MLLCRLRPWHMCHWSMYSTFNSFDLPSSWTWITMPSGGNPIRGSPTRSYPRAQPHPHHPLIWIKILEASWLMAFNHFDVPLKQTSFLAHATPSLCWLPQPALREKVVSAFAAFQSEQVWQMWCTVVKYSCTTGSPTVERELSFHCVHSPGVFSHALVRAGILLLEIWNFQHAAGLSHVHFPREWHIVDSPPAYRRCWAVKRGKCVFEADRVTQETKMFICIYLYWKW